MKKLLPQSIKNIYHLTQAILANFWFSFPSQKIKVIGITGTNGKTTTAQMVTKILEEADYGVAMISTINFKLGKKEWVNKTKFTTLSSWATQKFIKKAVNAKCEYLVLETSSHSLDQHRVWGVKYRTAVITNITREHLDYHKTMEKYRRAKLKLFKNVEVAVVNLDMKHPEEFISGDKNKIYGYALKNQKSKIKNQNDNAKVKIVQAKNIKLDADYSKFKIQNSKFKLHLPGKFNIENALAAVCVGLAEGISLKTGAKALEKIKGILGRMESVLNDRELNIIIDYAVTPDSLEKLYELVNEIKKTLPSSSNSSPPTGQAGFSKGGEPKIIAVLGSCGERDRGKRPIMGEIVSRFADYVIITNEDPYSENPQRIIDEVFSGVIKNQNAKLPEGQAYGAGKNQNDKSKSKNIIGVGALIKINKSTFIFQKRDKNTKWSPGQIAPFGGGIKINEIPKDALNREIKEELSIKISDKQIKEIGNFESHNQPKKYIKMFYVNDVEKENLKLKEGKEVVEINLDEALSNKLVTNFTKEVINYFAQNVRIENKNCWRILDRRKAIKKALQMAKPGDFVVITGKGAEETMAVGKKRIPWNDKKVVMQILANHRNE